MLYIIGGSSYSGKSTIAKRLGKAMNVDVVDSDRLIEKIIRESTTKDRYAYEWKTVNIIQILSKNSQKLTNDYINLYKEVFQSCINALSFNKDMIIEGSLFLPELLEKIDVPYQVIYLLTEEEYYYDNYTQRSYTMDMDATRDGKLALHNLMKRDMLFRAYILKDILSNNLKSIVINKKTNFDDVYHAVKMYLFR